MNRVILAGRLAGRPKLSYTPCGIPVADFRLLVPREYRLANGEEALERFDCVAFRDIAKELTTWGDRDYRINLEGRLRSETYRSLEGRLKEGVRVHTDYAYFLDPVAEGIGTDPRSAPHVPMPVAIVLRQS